MCQYFSNAEDLLNSIPSIYNAIHSDTLEETKETTETDETTGTGETTEIKANKDEELLEICEKIRAIGVEIYDNLNLSVIQGSYVKNSNFEDRIKNFAKTISSLDIPGELYDCVSDCFTKVLINSLKQYQYLTHQLHVNNNTPDKLFLLYDFKFEPLGNYQGDLIFDIKPHADLFQYNILISILDRDFSLDTNILRQLFEIRHELQKHELKENDICKLLIDKCNLLTFKFISKYNSDEYFRVLTISHDFIDTDIDLSKIEISYLIHFKDIISNTYPPKREENFNYLKQYYQNKRGEANTFEDFFIFVQFYRKVVEKVDNINQLISRFKKTFKPKEDSSNFYKRSYNICLNYLFNNKISLLSKQNFENIKDIDSIFTETKNLQDKTGIYNFFPYFKIAKCYIKFLNQLINKNSIDNYILIAQKAIKNLKDSIDYSKLYLKRNDLYSTLPFRPDFNGCCCPVKIGEKDFNIFIASAYIIPVNYEKYKDELLELEANHQIFKTITATQEFINATKEKVSGLDTKVTANTEAIATKASNEDLTALSSKVTALKNSVGDTTDAAKVDGSVYARIAKNKADIATKANQSDIPTAVQLVVKTI